MALSLLLRFVKSANDQSVQHVLNVMTAMIVTTVTVAIAMIAMTVTIVEAAVNTASRTASAEQLLLMENS
jgi:hypothetical protein